jgi:hypothetical protein
MLSVFPEIVNIQYQKTELVQLIQQKTQVLCPIDWYKSQGYTSNCNQHDMTDSGIISKAN